jgi:hypothetical protein
MNMTHVVHGFYFGTRPTPRKYYELKKLHPLGLNPEWLDKLHGQEFFSEHTQHTHEHYLQVRRVVTGEGARSSCIPIYPLLRVCHFYSILDFVSCSTFVHVLSDVGMQWY